MPNAILGFIGGFLTGFGATRVFFGFIVGPPSGEMMIITGAIITLVGIVTLYGNFKYL